MPGKQLIVPDRIKVGFQKRSDTYTGQLAYVIYFDHKGVLRKKTSWEGWRDAKIEAIEVPNEPIDGFVLNKKVGGYKSDWNYRSEHVRVYDPRDFEFEISVPNLLLILSECDCSRGKGLEGKFVYAWDGTELVLLPVNSLNYRESKQFTELQTMGIKSKELIPGFTYQTKKQEELTYLGRFNYHFQVATGNQSTRKNSLGFIKKYVFWNPKLTRKYDYETDKVLEGEPTGFTYMDTPKSIGVLQSDTVSAEFPELMENFHNSAHGSKVTRLFTKEVPYTENANRDYWSFQEESGDFVQCRNMYLPKTMTLDCVYHQSRYSIKNGILCCEAMDATAFRGDIIPDDKKHHYQHSYYNSYVCATTKWVEPTNHRLFAELESGSMFCFGSQTFVKDL